MRTALRNLLACVATLLACGVLTLHGQRPSPSPPGVRPASDALSRMADEVATDVEKLRGWTFTRPVRRERVDVASVRRYIEKQVALALPPARRATLQAFLRTAGLIPPECDLVASALAMLDQQVAGYYDPAMGTLYLVDRQDAMPEFMQRTVLAHELAHALDDQHVGLHALVDTTAVRTQDAEIVLSSLGEGSATSLMFHYLVGQTASGKINPLEATAYFGREMERVKAFGQMPRYFSAMFGSYLIGAAFLAKGDLQAVFSLPDDRATGENFRVAWTTPPRSSEQILHPEKYWSEAQRDEPVVIDDAAVERWLAQPARQVVYRDTLGELLTGVLTEPRDVSQDMGRLLSATAWTNPGAIGWGGDRFYLLASGQSAVTGGGNPKALQGVWVTAWDAAGERAEFVRALERGFPPPAYAAETTGNRVAIVFIGFEAPEREALMKRLQRAPLRMTKSGKPWS